MVHFNRLPLHRSGNGFRRIEVSASPPHQMHLLGAIVDRCNEMKTSFHVPGHKGTQLDPPPLQKLITDHNLQADLTEVPGLDNLANPEGVIKAAQEAASQVFHSHETHFLVNGSSVGIHAAVMACCPPHSTLLLPRNAHSSAFNACTLAGCRTVMIDPEVDNRFGIAMGVCPRTVQQVLEDVQTLGSTPSAAVLITSPTYYGICSDITGIAEVCRQHDVLLIVDEAHGSHFGLHPSFPSSAIQLGAHIAIQSTHKTLGAMTQAAMLHIGPNPPFAADLTNTVPRFLKLLQSTSPNYVLMASLDSATHTASTPISFTPALQCAAHIRASLSVARIPTLDASLSGSESSYSHDPLRVTFNARAWGMTGFTFLAALERLGVSCEMATDHVVVLALGIGSQIEHAVAFDRALNTLADEGPMSDGTANSNGGRWTIAGADRERRYCELDLRTVFMGESEAVEIEHAIGRCSAQSVSLYPPGIPIIYPGERVTRSKADALLSGSRAGGRVVGFDSGECVGGGSPLDEGHVPMIRVLVDSIQADYGSIKQ